VPLCMLIHILRSSATGNTSLMVALGLASKESTSSKGAPAKENGSVKGGTSKDSTKPKSKLDKADSGGSNEITGNDALRTDASNKCAKGSPIKKSSGKAAAADSNGTRGEFNQSLATTGSGDRTNGSASSSGLFLVEIKEIKMVRDR
jgi:hypothetical protein